jgi:Tfp pilus assembly protein PilP
VAVKSVSMKPTLIALKPVAAKAPTKAVPVAKAPVAAKIVPAAKAPLAKPTTMAKVDVKDTNTKHEGSEKEKKEDETSTKLISGVGKRDPFVSPVVAQSMSGSGCSVGKKCLAIDQITIRGVVKSDSGMIAVVVNALDKAYFLRENDPVFNGYVEKITEDSIIFKEMYQDKLGKSFTRDVTKRIQAPVV